MKNIIKKILGLGIFFFSLFITSISVLALEVQYSDIGGLSLNDTSSFGEYICYIYGLVISITVIIVSCVIVYGGILYLVSYSRGKFTTEAKEWIKAGITGLLIILCSYLTLYTINPALTECAISAIPGIDINANPFGDEISSNTKILTYREIPIGTLTETLLSREISCYAFDAYGDPLQGGREGLDNECSNDSDCSSKQWCNNITGKCAKYFPTYTDHDRADCLTQATEGAVKKSETIALLSDEIAKLMQQCSCEGKCNPTCDPAEDGCNVQGPCGGGSCYGPCVDGECEQPEGTEDCCPPGVKEQIEHGPIKLGITIDIFNPDYVPSTDMPEPDGSCYASLGTINTDLRNRTFYVTPELYDEALAAMQAWNNATGTNLFGSLIIDENLSDNHPSISNGRNEIYTSTAMDGMVPAGALAWDQNNPITMSESDIGLGGNHNTGDASTDSSAYDIQSLLTHELGHALGLKDLYTDECEGAMMYGYMGAGQVKRELSAADIAGIETYYNITATPQEVPISNEDPAVGEEDTEDGEGGETTEGGQQGGSPVEKEFHGLDEFRCPNPIEHEGHPELDPEYRSCDDIASHVEEEIEIDDKKYITINKSKWNKLNLIQQLNYFRPEIDRLIKTVKDDKKELEKATDKLSSCYMAMSYSDLIKVSRETDQNKNIILTKNDFSDPQTREKISVDKYCNGFNYNNSSCLKKCNDLCPDVTAETIGDYGACFYDNDSQACIESAYKERLCDYAPDSEGEDGTSPQNFEECISSCQNECSTMCSQKYLSDSGEYSFCINQCNDNGQCVLDNAGTCLIDGEDFAYCGVSIFTEEDDLYNLENCINNAYLCKSGSNENAGFASCVDSNVSGCSTNDFSASSLYRSVEEADLNCEKCPLPYETSAPGSTCYSRKNTSATCSEICPETQKCPTSSDCPDCFCSKIDEEIAFSVPNESNKQNVGKAGFSLTSRDVKEYQMVGPQCNEYSYNDDSLTFYCRDEWWASPVREGQSETPIGQQRYCSKAQEIPVGQAVDDARDWATNLTTSTDKISNDIQKVIDEMLILGEAIETDPIQDYCKCQARFEDDTPICKTGCQYDWWTVFIEGYGPICQHECMFDPCKGKPCEQMTDYITKLWNYFRTLKMDYIDFYIEMVKEPRSDIMKELTYSRKTANKCSLVSNVYDLKTRLMSCSKVKREIISPFNKGETIYNGEEVGVGCYGESLGDEVGKSLTDNWYCCEQYNFTDEEKNYITNFEVLPEP